MHTGVGVGDVWEGDHLKYIHRWKDNIKMDLQYVKCRVMYWIALAHDKDRWHAVVNIVINL